MLLERKLNEELHGWGIYKNSFFYIDSDDIGKINEVKCDIKEGVEAETHELDKQYREELEAIKLEEGPIDEGDEAKENRRFEARTKNWFEEEGKEGEKPDENCDTSEGEENM